MAGAAEQPPPDQSPTSPPRKPRGGGDDDAAAARRYGLLGIGFEFVAAICLFGAIGWWIDRRVNSFPWLTLVGAAVGFAVGLTMLIRAGRNAFKD